MLIEILTTAEPTAPEKRRRLWLEPGETTAVAGFLLMAVVVRDEPLLDLYDPAGVLLAQLPLAPASFEPTAPYRIIPRAQRRRSPGCPAAVFLELQYTGNDKPGWHQREDNTNANLQPISDAG